MFIRQKEFVKLTERVLELEKEVSESKFNTRILESVVNGLKERSSYLEARLNTLEADYRVDMRRLVDLQKPKPQTGLGELLTQESVEESEAFMKLNTEFREAWKQLHDEDYTQSLVSIGDTREAS